MIRRSLKLHCPPAAAFSAFTSAEEITTWWGDDNSYRTVEWQASAEAGGAWRALFASPQGQTFSSSGIYTAVEHPTVLDWTWAAEWDPAAIKKISMRFDSEGAGTRMTVISEGHASEEEQNEDERGWDEILGWLTNYLSRRHALEGM